MPGLGQACGCHARQSKRRREPGFAQNGGQSISGFAARPFGAHHEEPAARLSLEIRPRRSRSRPDVSRAPQRFSQERRIEEEEWDVRINQRQPFPREDLGAVNPLRRESPRACELAALFLDQFSLRHSLTASRFSTRESSITMPNPGRSFNSICPSLTAGQSFSNQ